MTAAEAVRWYMQVSVLRTPAERIAAPKPGTLSDALAAMEQALPGEATVDAGEFVAMWTMGKHERRSA